MSNLLFNVPLIVCGFAHVSYAVLSIIYSFAIIMMRTIELAGFV